MTLHHTLRPPAGTPLYVHVPFCVAKCPYCDFFSLAADGHDLAGTVDLLLIEAEHRAPRHPRTVFLGGGTPSLLPPPLLQRLLDGLDRITGFRTSAGEVSAECNPESLDGNRARALLEGGVNRLSIGFQSLRPATLVLFGRVHTVDQSFAAYDAARAAGCARVNIDLIYGSPGQAVPEWTEDLGRVLDLGPDHLATYELTFEEGTPFHRWQELGRVSAARDELALALFRATRAAVRDRGLESYEISNHARPGEECAHNLGYWRNEPYLGLGPSAVSKVGHARCGNPRSLGGWSQQVRALARGEPRLADGAFEEELDPAGRLGETWWLGLRTARGVHPAEARRTAAYPSDSAPTPYDPAEALARGLAEEAVLEVRGERYRLAETALALADAVGRRFLATGANPAPRADSPARGD